MKKDTNYRRKQIELLIDNRIKKLEKELLEETLKGLDHKVEISVNRKATVVFTDGTWVTEFIRTAILKHNYKIDQTNKMVPNQFDEDELDAVDEILNQDPTE